MHLFLIEKIAKIQAERKKYITNLTKISEQKYVEHLTE